MAGLDAKKLLTGLLDVMDNLERAVLSQDAGSGAVNDGVRAIHRQMSDLLYKHGVRGFDARNQPFDARVHEAIGLAYSQELPPRHVVEVVSNGYYLEDKLFRPARVMVSTQDPEAGAVRNIQASQKAEHLADKSAINRPAWVGSAPRHSPQYLFFVGRSKGHKDLEAGKDAARDQALGELLQYVVEDPAQSQWHELYQPLVDALRPDVLEGVWGRFRENAPRFPVQEDCFWERVRSEISGVAYDVAILLAVPVAHYQALFKEHGEPERWTSVELVSPGPLLQAFFGEVQGALVLSVRRLSTAERAGLSVGDLIYQINFQNVQDAVTTRRFLTRAASSKPQFDVHLYRYFAKAPPCRVTTRRPARR